MPPRRRSATPAMRGDIGCGRPSQEHPQHRVVLSGRLRLGSLTYRPAFRAAHARLRPTTSLTGIQSSDRSSLETGHAVIHTPESAAAVTAAAQRIGPLLDLDEHRRPLEPVVAPVRTNGRPAQRTGHRPPTERHRPGRSSTTGCVRANAVGAKLGPTSRVKRSALGIDEPVFGRLTSGMLLPSGAYGAATPAHQPPRRTGDRVPDRATAGGTGDRGRCAWPRRLDDRRCRDHGHPLLRPLPTAGLRRRQRGRCARRPGRAAPPAHSASRSAAAGLCVPLPWRGRRHRRGRRGDGRPGRSLE